MNTNTNSTHTEDRLRDTIYALVYECTDTQKHTASRLFRTQKEKNKRCS